MSKIVTVNAVELSVPAPFAGRLRRRSNRSAAHLRVHALTIVKPAVVTARASVVVGPYLNFDPLVLLAFFAAGPAKYPTPGPSAEAG